jgi:hypothetical protein
MEGGGETIGCYFIANSRSSIKLFQNLKTGFSIMEKHPRRRSPNKIAIRVRVRVGKGNSLVLTCEYHGKLVKVKPKSTWG